jgi:hypothetical protein
MQRKKKEKGEMAMEMEKKKRRLEGWKHVQVRVECKVKDMR